MGRIKSKIIKKTAKSLAKETVFNSDFNHNKELLKGEIESKKVRNQIAGYIARLKKIKA